MHSPLRLRHFAFFALFALALIALADWFAFREVPDPRSQQVVYDMQKNVADIEPAVGVEEPEVPQQFIEIIPSAVTADLPDVPDFVYEEPIGMPLEEALDTPAPVLKSPDVKGKVAIIIDDVGMNIYMSREVLKLPSEVTLAILPYAEKAREFAEKGKAQKHELIVHVPMETMDPNMDLGSLSLVSSKSDAEFETDLMRILGAFDGYIGINNHMGSKLTQDRVAMEKVMTSLKSNGLAFLDSRTIHTSIAADVAAEYDVPYAVRDVFLDHEETDEFVQSALERVERIALQKGSAVAIGHPKEVTVRNLKKWIETLEAKGLELVPLSAVLIQEDNTPYLSVAPIDDVPGPKLPLPPG